MHKIKVLLGRTRPNAIIVLLSSVALILAAGQALADSAELTLLCGAGLRQPVEELMVSFEKQTGIKVGVEYDGSGKALVRYQATGIGDVFLPGSQVYVEQLRKLGQAGESFPVVRHIPVLAVNPAHAASIEKLEDLAKPGVRVGLGDAKAMALGRTADEILEKKGLTEAVARNLTVRAATVKQLALYILNGDVDAEIGRAHV